MNGEFGEDLRRQLERGPGLGRVEFVDPSERNFYPYQGARPGGAVPEPLLRRGSAHYRTLDPQPIEVIQAWGMPFDSGCALKYIARVHSDVNGHDKNLDDLDKAIHYLELWRGRLQREHSQPSSESSSG